MAARLRYLHSVSTGDKAVLHKATDIWKALLTESQLFGDSGQITTYITLLIDQCKRDTTPLLAQWHCITFVLVQSTCQLRKLLEHLQSMNHTHSKLYSTNYFNKLFMTKIFYWLSPCIVTITCSHGWWVYYPSVAGNISHDGRYSCNIKVVIFKGISGKDILSISYEIGFRWMSQCWSVNIGSGNGLVLSLPEPRLTQISVTIWHH